MSPAHYHYDAPDRRRDGLRTVLFVLGLLLVLGVLVYAGWRLAKDAGAPRKKQAQQISLVKPPLPPKPPPEPERPKEQVKQEIKPPEPKPEPKPDDSPPPAQDLGLDAKGVAGGDNFGLVGRPGGRDITTIGAETGTGTGGKKVNSAFYASQLQAQVQEVLNQDERLRRAEYRALVNLWVNGQGKVTRVEVAGSTGDGDLDRRLREVLEEAKKLRPPPEGIALPIRMELVARRT
ncbi:MAG TPA: energy transducer TonB [Burkholderiales bacterium]|nr:energy transducer TonB [Burkholderiales bacterium]